MPKSAEKSASRMDISLVRMTCAPRVGQITATALMSVVSAADEHYMIVSDLYTCYESLERVIGINHKYWNHGKIKGDKSVITPFDIRNGVILTLEG